MRTLRTIGIAGGAIAFLLSSSIAFAESRPTPPGPGGRADAPRAALSSTTASTTMKAKGAKALERAGDIKDKTKQEKAAALATQFDDLNKTWTDHFTNMLDQYDAILGKVESRASTLAAGGKDVTPVLAAIQSAQTAIADARTAVATQAAKTYTVDASTLPTTATSTASGQEKLMQSFRKSFQALHSGLFKDLFALRDGPMASARKAVQAAIRALGQASGLKEGTPPPTATSTATSSSQQ